MQRLHAIHSFAQFARLASESAGGSDALQLLADSLVEHAGCDACAVFQVTSARLAIAAARNLPERLRSWTADEDDVDSALGSVFLNESAGDFVESKTLPLVSGGGLFGAVVLLWKGPADGQEQWHDEFAHGLVDLAATILATSAHVQTLVRTNEALQRSREVLARTEKLRALGQMAAGVSHDLKNILNPLSLHLQVAQRANAKGNKAEVDEGLRAMKDALARGVDVLERLRHFSRQTPDTRAMPIDLNTCAHEAVLLAKPRLALKSGRLCRVHEEYGAPPTITGVAGELVSAVLNLLVNALDAFADAEAEAEAEAGEITVRTGERDGGAWITVKDNGPGMSAELQTRVFEPFFTTKGEEGTGLGLATVYAAVTRHGGTVSLVSERGKGAAFTMWFPAAT